MSDQYYEKVSNDDGSSDGLVSGQPSTRILRAPPTSSKRSILTKIALGAVGLTVFIFAVSVVSSAIAAYRLPAAVAAAQAAQPVTPPAVSSSASAVESSTSTATSAATKPTTTPLDLSFLTHQETRSCGSTPDEARAAGCVFDVMMQLWTPPECMDYNLSERFLKNGNWTWYSNSGGVDTYSDEEIRLGNHDVVYVDQSYHRHHCIFAWERLVRALRNQAPLIEELISYDHVMHCRHNTLRLPSEGAEQVRGVVAPTGYTKCASYDVWAKHLPANSMSSTD